MALSKLYVVLHDIHWPKINRAVFAAVMDFISHNEIAGLTFGGDQFDFEEISHHNKKKALYKVPGSYRRNILTFDDLVLTPLERLLPKGAEKVWHIGNHERFEFDLIEEHPEFEGLVDHTQILNLRSRGWKVMELGHASKIGKLNVVHGEILTGNGNQASMYPSRKAVELYGANVLAGHVHYAQSFTRVSPVENTQKHMGWIAPCMCNLNPDYLRNRPTAWINGFTIVELMEGGAFNLYPVIVTKGRFSFAGRVYGRKEE